MSLLLNRAKQLTTTTGTGTINLDGAAVSPFLTWPLAGAVTGKKYTYLIEDGTAWEIGEGVFTDAATDTLSRTLIASSTGAPLDLTGSASVACVASKKSFTAASLFQIRLFGSNTASVSIAVNSTTYINPGHPLGFTIDRSLFPATHYRIIMRAVANAAGQNVKVQLTAAGAPTVPIHTGGDDLTFPDVTTTVDSGWLTFDDSSTSSAWIGILACKGSNATVDLNVIGACEIMFKIEH